MGVILTQRAFEPTVYGWVRKMEREREREQAHAHTPNTERKTGWQERSSLSQSPHTTTISTTTPSYFPA